MVVDDEFPQRVGAAEVGLDPALQLGIGGIDIIVGVQAEEVRVAMVVGVIRHARKPLAGALAELPQDGGGGVRADDRSRIGRRIGAVQRQVHGRIIGESVVVVVEIAPGRPSGILFDTSWLAMTV